MSKDRCVYANIEPPGPLSEISIQLLLDVMFKKYSFDIAFEQIDENDFTFRINNTSPEFYITVKETEKAYPVYDLFTTLPSESKVKLGTYYAMPNSFIPENDFFESLFNIAIQ